MNNRYYCLICFYRPKNRNWARNLFIQDINYAFIICYSQCMIRGHRVMILTQSTKMSNENNKYIFQLNRAPAPIDVSCYRVDFRAPLRTAQINTGRHTSIGSIIWLMPQQASTTITATFHVRALFKYITPNLVISFWSEQSLSCPPIFTPALQYWPMLISVSANSTTIHISSLLTKSTKPNQFIPNQNNTL